MRSIGTGTISAIDINSMNASGASFDPPNSATGHLGLIGLELDPAPDLTDISGAIYEPLPQTFSVTNNTATGITTDPADGDMTQAAAVNDNYSGVCVLDNLYIQGKARLTTGDDLYVLGSVTINSGSYLTAHRIYQAGYYLGQTLYTASLNFEAEPVALVRNYAVLRGEGQMVKGENEQETGMQAESPLSPSWERVGVRGKFGITDIPPVALEFGSTGVLPVSLGIGGTGILPVSAGTPAPSFGTREHLIALAQTDTASDAVIASQAKQSPLQPTTD
ncbi:MAG: hypothetical protein HZA78_00920, partial [Candidatus Schekmanbacteria bacterium]|nr:hypothetical protein [Candidatus Schekmanbacteria bacterium]